MSIIRMVIVDIVYAAWDQVVFPLINFPCLERDDYLNTRQAWFIPIVNLKR